MPRKSAYRILRDHLAALPPESERCCLSLLAIERLLGRALPPSAYHVEFWTARAATGLGAALRETGFHAELTVTETGLAVVFTRRTVPVMRRRRGRGRGIRGPEIAERSA